MSSSTVLQLVTHKKILASAPWLGEPDDNVDAKLMKAVETLGIDVEDETLFGKTMLCVPLNLKHGTGSKVSYYGAPGAKMFSGAGSFPKRQRQEALAKYDRLVEFADLNDAGNCFVMIFKEQSKAKLMLKYCTDASAIGTPMLLGNPLKSPGTMARSGLPIVEADFPLVPLTVEAADFDITTVIPEVKIQVPEEPGALKYFVLHGVNNVKITRFFYVTESVSCTGLMCDRARELVDKNVSCGCINTGFDSRATVAKVTVKIPVPQSVNGTDHAEVTNFRSQRFTELVVADNKAMQKKDNAYFSKNYMKHNFAIRNLVDFVNTNGGWSIVGWFRRGASADSSTEGATAESFATTLHISLLVPTSSPIRHLKDDEFNKLRLSSANVTATAGNSVE